MTVRICKSDPPGNQWNELGRNSIHIPGRKSITSTLLQPHRSTASEMQRLELLLDKRISCTKAEDESIKQRTASTTSSCTESDEDSGVSFSENSDLYTANSVEFNRENTLAIDAWNEVALEYHARVEKFTSQFLPFLLNRNFLIENDVEQLDDVRYLYGMNVLDVAAGTGAAALYAVSKGAQVTAIDFSEEMLKIAQIRARDTSFDAGYFESRLADGENLPMQWTDKFDITCSNFGVIYFSDMNKGLEEMVRCTKPGGRVCFSAWGKKEMTSAFRLFPAAIKECGFENRWRGSSDKPSFFLPTRRISADKHFLYESLQEAGLSDVKVIGPFSREMRLKSAEEYWYRFVLGCPNVKRVVEHYFTEKERLKLKETVMRLVNEEARGAEASNDHDLSLSSLSTAEIPDTKSRVAIADSGATHHLWPDYSAFVSYTKVSNKYVSLADKSTAPIEGIGDIAVSLNGKKVLIRNAYHAPSLKVPLYSLGAHRRLPGCGFIGTNDSFQLTFPKFSLTLHDVDLPLLKYAPLEKNNKSSFDYIEPRRHTPTPIVGKNGSIVLSASAYIAIGTKEQDTSCK
jgi:SAM-dependent methyltransferase